MSGVVVNDNWEKSEKIVKFIYFLYIAGLFLGGITFLIGVIIAYIYQDEAPEWLKTHYRFQIRTFWIGILFLAAALPLVFVFIGFFLLLFLFVWLVVRCVKGFKLVNRQAEHPNPTGWLF